MQLSLHISSTVSSHRSVRFGVNEPPISLIPLIGTLQPHDYLESAITPDQRAAPCRGGEPVEQGTAASFRCAACGETAGVRRDVPGMCSDVLAVDQVPRKKGDALGMEDQQDALVELIAWLSGSDRASELALRLGQSLEITDGLWKLVPTVVAAGEAHDQRSAVDVADNSPVGLALSDGARCRLRKLADDFSQATDVADNRQPVLRHDPIPLLDRRSKSVS
jgi:hypothetical protein